VSGIRLLALDVDGTLAARRNEVSEATRQALERAAASGVEIVISTGRRYRTTCAVIEALGFPVAAVCLGGALVKEADGSTLAARHLEPEEFRAITALVREQGLVTVAQRDSHDGRGADFLIDGSLAWDPFVQAYHNNNESHAEWRRDLGAEARDDVLVAGTFGEEARLRGLADEVARRFGERFAARLLPPANSMRGWYCEILPADVCKWQGLSALARARKLDPDAICAVGDGENDLSMVQAAGVGVAMANAHAALLEVADWVTGRHDEDGLVAVVERILGEG
jgi:Cof subfamily protein (haloacid dehalogenase superfamily)